MTFMMSMSLVFVLKIFLINLWRGLKVKYSWVKQLP